MKDQIKNLLRPHFIDLEGYVSAGMQVEKNDETIFMNANENPFALPGLEGLNRYPKPQPPELAEVYARAYGVNANQIVMTRGADEALQLITKLFCEPHKNAVIICPPTFGMYAVNANATPANLIEIPLIKSHGTFKLDKDAIIKAVYNPAHSIKLVYICSPNNPTGTSFSRDDIKEILTELEGQAIVILDETYAEFAQEKSMANDLQNFPNLIILRTLSKSYSMAGMRMGCFISSDRDFVRLVKEKALDSYPLPQASIEAAFHVLSPEISEIAEENREKLLIERDRLIPLLEGLDYIKYIYPSDANFLLVEFEDAKAVADYCAQNKLILRDFSSKPLTKNCLRISIGTAEENEKLITLLNNFKP